MPKKGVKTERPPIGDINDPDSLYNSMLRFLQWQAEKNYSPKTIENREVYLRYFIQWCDERGLGQLTAYLIDVHADGISHLLLSEVVFSAQGDEPLLNAHANNPDRSAVTHDDICRYPSEVV